MSSGSGSDDGKASPVQREDGGGAGAASISAKRRRAAKKKVEDPLHAEREAMLKTFQARLAELPQVGGMKKEQVLASEADLRLSLTDLLEQFDAEVGRLCTKLPRPEGVRGSAAELSARIRTLSTLPDRDELVLEQMRQQALQLLSLERGREFATQFTDPLRRKIVDRLGALDRKVEGAHRVTRNEKLAERVDLLLKNKAAAAAAAAGAGGAGAAVSATPLVTARTLATVEFEASPACQTVLNPPMSMARKIERVFCVAMDRMPRLWRTYLIAGRQEDVDAAVAFLTTADFSAAPKAVLKEPRIMAQVVGRGGANIRHLEDRFQCFFDTAAPGAGDREVTVYGRPDRVKAAVAHLEGLSFEQGAAGAGGAGGAGAAGAAGATADRALTIEVDSGAKVRALKSVFSRVVRDVEGERNVAIHLVFGAVPVKAVDGGETVQTQVFGGDVTASGGGAVGEAGGRAGGAAAGGASRPAAVAAAGARRPPRVPGATPCIIIRPTSKASQLEAARGDLEKFLASLEVRQVPCASLEAVQRLFSHVRPNGEIDVAGYGASWTASGSPTSFAGKRSVGERFCDFVGTSPDVAFLRWGQELALVGAPENVARVAEQAAALVEVAGYTPVSVRVTAAQLGAFSQRRLALIAEETGASVVLRKLRAETGGASLEIVGSPEAREKAHAQVLAVLENEACVAVVPVPEKASLDHLLARQAAVVRALEQQHAVRISVNRAEKSCSVTGSAAHVAAAEKALIAVNEENARMVNAAVPIPALERVGRLIGARGANINRLRETTGVAVIDVNNRDMKVYLRGLPEAVKKAEALVIKALADDPRDAGDAPGGARPAAAAAAGGAAGAAGGAAGAAAFAAPAASGAGGWGGDVSAPAPRAGAAGGGWSASAGAGRGAAAASGSSPGFFPSLEEAAGGSGASGAAAASAKWRFGAASRKVEKRAPLASVPTSEETGPTTDENAAVSAVGSEDAVGAGEETVASENVPQQEQTVA